MEDGSDTARGTPVLRVRDLRVRFESDDAPAHVVNGLSYDLYESETLAIVGESGSGKSISALSLLGLVPQPPARVSGEVLYGGTNLVGQSPRALRDVRGRGIGMIFQDPMTSLNPVLTVGRQIGEVMQRHLGASERSARARAQEMLELVGIPAARRRLSSYPHQFSGGMRQRVMIAMALACEPRILIADEPTTALDVTIQAQFIELVKRLQAEIGMAVIWITHDLAVVAGLADRVVVMYAGRVVEQAGVEDLYRDPLHPYTRGLLGSLPMLGARRQEDLYSIGGSPPEPASLPAGCAFWPRCPHRLDPRCETQVPELVERGPGHAVRCFYDARAAGVAADG